LARIYPHALLAETLNVAAQCNFSLGELRYEYPEEIVPPGESPASYLRKLTYQGLCERYRRPGINAKLQGEKRLLGAQTWMDLTSEDGAAVRVPQSIAALIEKELALIAQLRYEAFFLTVHDIVRFARSQNILCQGRGSAANSAVCYCLGITEVDPGRTEVLFERFISKERDEAPDIDVDFEHERREEVIQYVYRRYGRERTALAATLITYRPRSALRDVGKALGLNLDQVDQLAKNFQWWDDSVAHERAREAGLDPDNPTVINVIALSRALLGFPRHLSQHVGGFVIARDKLSRLVPIENAAMPERTVIQWDKDDLEALGLLKVDVLGLGMLSAIRRTLQALNAFTGGDMQVGDIPPEDPRVYDMICAADTIGVFQIESRAQMSMLPRLQPRCFYDLVIEVAIVRPGPIQGGMVHPYLRRRRGLEPVTYPSKSVEKVLERTLGVSIFQEQVMQLAMVAAGFTAGEADQLRRAMAAWKRKGGLEPFRDKLLAGMLARGYAADYAEQLFRQIQGFGEYGFPESHAASFALLAYVSSWLKCHHPAAFACGLLNAQPLGFYAPSQLVQDAQRHGVEVRAVDVTVSGWDCVLEQGALSDSIARTGTPASPALRLGLRLVNGLSKHGAQRIVSARTQHTFAGIADLAERAQLDQRDLNALARADALRSLAWHRRDAYWQTLGTPRPLREETLALGNAGDSTQAELLPPSEAQDIVADYAALGLTLRRHPLALLRPRLKGAASAQQVKSAQTGQRLRVSGIVTCRQRPDTASGVIFVTLEDETGYVNVVVWPRLVERQRRELLAARLLTVHGKIERDGEVVHLIARRLEDDSALLGKLEMYSRNFH
jgi:error-prone DNA polymerase